MKFSPNIENETAQLAYTHRLDFSWRDIPAGVATNTSYVWAAGFLPAVVAGDEVIEVYLHLTEEFANTADAAFNSTTLDLGDAGSATRFLSGIQINKNGTPADDTHASDKNYIYAAAGQLQLRLNSMTAKSLSSLNKGIAYIEFNIFRASAKDKNLATPFGTGYS